MKTICENWDMDKENNAAPRLIRLHAKDNVAAVTTAVDIGQMLELEGKHVRAAEPVPTGHKMAIVDIDTGEKVVKYGVAIGSATCSIKPGQYVHTHNLKSDYLPTYTLDGANPYLHGTGEESQ